MRVELLQQQNGHHDIKSKCTDIDYDIIDM